MSSKKVLVVFGATGGQGGSVIRSVLADPKAASQFIMRGVTRDKSKSSAQALAAKGVEMVNVSIVSFGLLEGHRTTYLMSRQPCLLALEQHCTE